MKFANFIGPGSDQVFVTSVELRTAKIGRREMHILNRGARGTADYYDALGKSLPKRFHPVTITDHLDNSKPPVLTDYPMMPSVAI